MSADSPNEKPRHTWTLFWDMHSGGGQKLDWAKIYIEAPEKEACRIFAERFEREPYNETCECCGEDYAIHDDVSLEKLSAYHRGDRGHHGDMVRPLAEYEQDDGVLVLRAPDYAIPAGKVKP